MNISSLKEIPHFVRDAAGELTTEATEVNSEKASFVQKMIFENKKKCLEKMEQDPPYDKSGTDTVYWKSLPTSLICFIST